MKRKLPSLTLWNAAFVNGSGTLRSWVDKTQIREYTDSTHSCSSCTYRELPAIAKVQKIDNQETVTTFSVGILPTSKQKSVLNQMLKVSNYAYNWCNYLVKEKSFKPLQPELQKVVTKTNAESVPFDYRLPGDEWYFENNMSSIKLTSCKNFCTMYKSAQTSQKKKKLHQDINLRDKDISHRQIGSFQVQQMFVRLLTEKDSPSTQFRNCRIALMPQSFSKTKKDIMKDFYISPKMCPNYHHLVKT